MATTSDRPGAEHFVPGTLDLEALRDAAAGCEGCELYRDATQTVFGKGPSAAAMMLIGEQPGDLEDQQGVPFIGPAGRLLRKSMQASGIDVEQVYLTNAVKHFRWKATAQGNRRIHQKPAAGNVAACRPWLHAELRSVRPAVVVAPVRRRRRRSSGRSSR
jgi:DNA polymerase